MLAQAQIGQRGVQTFPHDPAMPQFHLVDSARSPIPHPVAQRIDEEDPHPRQSPESLAGCLGHQMTRHHRQRCIGLPIRVTMDSRQGHKRLACSALSDHRGRARLLPASDHPMAANS